MTIEAKDAAGWWIGPVVATATVLAAGAARAADAVAPPLEVTRLTGDLVGLFVVATVMETALAALFDWRLYREFFNGRALKTLVMFGFGWAVVTTFDYDVFRRILQSLGVTGEAGPLSTGLSALVLSGGSAGVHRLFVSLGLRPPADLPVATARPPADKAWISVRVIRKHAVGDVEILVDAVKTPSPEAVAAPPLAGVVRENPLRRRIRDVFFTDRLRWPPSGGHEVASETVHRVTVRATTPDATGATSTTDLLLHEGRFCDRAVIDFVVTI